jgi:drug/metabolite transporter (DMT)-like permease
VTVTIIFALAAALANAAHLMTQHTASVGVSGQHRSWALVAYLIRQPLWLLGWAAAAGGFVFQAIALHQGQLSVVQALLVTELVFALVLRRFWVRQHITKTAWIAALVTCAALAVFLTAAEPHGGHLRPNGADWAVASAVFGGIVAALAIAARWGSPARRAALYAIAASITWALMAAFIKETTNMLAVSGVVGVLEHWSLYALLAECVATSHRGGRPGRRHCVERLDLRRALHCQCGPEGRGRCGLLRDGDCGRRPGTNGPHRSRFDHAGQDLEGPTRTATVDQVVQ